MEPDSVKANGISQRTVHQDGRCHLWPTWGSSLPLAGHLCSNPSVKRFQKGRSWFNFNYDPEHVSFIPQLLCLSQLFLTQLFYKSTRIYLHPIYLSWGQDSRIGTAVGSLESVANLRLFRSDKKSNQHFQLSRGSGTGKKTSTTLNFERDTVRRIYSPKIDLNMFLLIWMDFVPNATMRNSW